MYSIYRNDSTIFNPQMTAQRGEALKKVTIKDIAREAGVSISVVSYVLNNNTNVSISEKTKEKVINAAKSLNYTPNSIARSMRTNKSMVIGLATLWNVSDSVFTETLKGVDSVAQKNDYSVIYCNLQKDQKGDKIVTLYNQRQIDGVILLSYAGSSGGFNETDFIKNVKKNNMPNVIINGSTEFPEVSYVYIDYYATAYMAVDHLYKLGHRKLCYMYPNKSEENSIQSIQRINGYKDAVEQIGIYSSTFLLNIDSLNKLPELMTSGDRPTAIVANKVNYAVHLLKMCIKLGIRVPDDVSVIACNDDHYASYLTPPLTTVKVPIYEMGEKSAELLFDSLTNRKTDIKIKLSNKIIERESCSKVKQGKLV